MTDSQYLSLADIEAFDPRHRRTGGDFTHACCPLCGGSKKRDRAHQSLSYSEKTGAYRCYRCSATGTLKEFWRPSELPSFENKGRQSSYRSRTASLTARFAGSSSRSRIIPQSSGLDGELPVENETVGQAVTSPPSEKTLEQKIMEALGPSKLFPATDDPAATYLLDRGLSPQICHDAGVRFARSFYGRAAVAFAVREENGKLVALQGRYIDGKDNPRMRTLGNRGRGVFWSPGALNKDQVAVFVEAPIDALTLHVAGIPAIALCGSDGVPEWLLRRLAFRTDVVAAFDADEAGERASVKLATTLVRYGACVKRLRPIAGKDWNDVLRQDGMEQLQAQTDPLRCMSEPEDLVHWANYFNIPAEFLAMGREADEAIAARLNAAQYL